MFMCKTLLCAIAKCENAYIMEWITWHLKLGFDKIVIYDNNNPNGERIKDAVGNLKNVEIIEWIGKTQGSCEIQVAAYNDCYSRHMDYDWIAFFDIDEFLEFKDGMPLKEYLSQEWIKNANSIVFNWKCYSDNGHINKPDGLVTESYTELCKDNYVNKYVKQIYRGGNKNLNMLNVHYSNKQGNTFLQNGIRINDIDSGMNMNINYDFGWLRHYVTKSMEEYVKIKYARRSNGSSKARLNLDFYFNYNEVTREKKDAYYKFISEIGTTNEIPKTSACKSENSNNGYRRPWWENMVITSKNI